MGVVIYHLLSALFPSLTFENDVPHPWIATSLFSVLFNGRFFVYVFFVLSGLVIANSAARSSQPLWLRLPLRYLRLTVPAVASIALACVLIPLFPTAAQDLGRIVPQQWITHFGLIKPQFPTAVLQSPVSIYLHTSQPLNGALWTMRIELIGSFCVYLAYSATFWKYRLPLLGVLSIASIWMPYHVPLFSFFVGAALRELWAHEQLPVKTGWPIPAILTGALGVFLGSLHPSPAFDPQVFLWPLGGAMLIVSVLLSSGFSAALSTTAPQFLGRISFSFYLLHTPLLRTVAAATYVQLAPLSTAMLASFVAVFLIATLLLSYAMTIALDEPLLRFLKWIGQSLSGTPLQVRSK